MASMVEKTTDEEERRTTIMETVQVSFAIFYLWMWQHKKNLNRSRINEFNFVPLVCARRFDGILFSLIIAERAFHTLFLTLTEQTIQMIPMSFPSDIVSFSSLFFFSSIHSQNFQTKAFSFGKHRYNFFSFRSLRIFHFAWGETLTHSLLHVVFRIFGRYTNEYSIHMGYQKKIETIVLRQSNGKMKRDGMHLIRWLACWIFNISMFGKTMCINDNRTLKHTVYISTILWNIQCRCVMLNFILNVLQSILNVAPRTK